MPLKKLIRNPTIKLQKGSKRKRKSHLEKKKILKPTYKLKTLKKQEETRN
jgi:hypothetical protein